MSDLSDIEILLEEMRAKIAYQLHKETNTTWLVTLDRELLDFHFRMKTAFPKQYDKSSRELPEKLYARISQSLSILDIDERTVFPIIDRIVVDASVNYFTKRSV